MHRLPAVVVAYRWAVLAALPFASAAACSSSKSTGFDDNTVEAGPLVAADGEPASSGGIVASSGAPGSLFGDGGFAEAAALGSAGPCKSGLYEGSFQGMYTSSLTGIGIPITVLGDVELTLNPAGSVGQKCQLDGEFKDCSTIFAITDGHVTGVANAFKLGDATISGVPYFCTVTGTLDCDNRKIVDGWIQCTYCLGSLADGGMGCTLPLFGGNGIGGHFAGPATGDYDINTLAFVNGTWNGAEALAGNDGGSLGPDGAPTSSFLSDSGYLGPNNFGGSGTWNAAYLGDH